MLSQFVYRPMKKDDRPYSVYIAEIIKPSDTNFHSAETEAAIKKRERLLYKVEHGNWKNRFPTQQTY